MVNPLSLTSRYRQYNLKKVEGLQHKLEARIEKSVNAGKLRSAAVYFRDLTNDHWFGINETEAFSPASLLKVPVMIAILKYADELPGLLNRQLKYKGPAEQQYKKQINSKTALISGREYSVDRLLDIMIVESDNEATILLMQFLDKENPGFRQKVEKELGFESPAGTDYRNDYVSVRRYSSFFRTLYNASYLSQEMSEKALQLLAGTGFGYGIRQAVPKEVTVCHKYGYRVVEEGHHQYHHFGIIYHQRKPFLLGVMSRGSSPGELKKLIASLAAIVYKEVDEQTRDNDYLKRDIE